MFKYNPNDIEEIHDMSQPVQLLIRINWYELGLTVVLVALILKHWVLK